MGRRLNLLLTTFIGLVLIIFIQSCECPLQEANVYSNCQVREATITKFNPNGSLQQIQNPDGTSSLVFVPDPLYSIHTFLFPFDQSMSGTLVNDERFSKSSTITIVKIPFSDLRPYFLAILDNFPQNNDINGDILLYNVANDFSYAEIRVFGEITRVNRNFNSENSTEFCKLVNDLTRDTAEIRNLKRSLSKFGQNLPNSIILNYNQANLVVLDTGNNVVTGITPLQKDIDYVLNLTSNKSVNLVVRVGDVYLYRAKNGKYFIFAVTDIRQGTLSPNKRRLTIMFSEIN
ncbi:MAG: ribosome-inactivating family protein [Ignavibacteria bacterium]|nr:ribosome-inactivating family protein [Ignavibacteria bacterium]